MSRAHPYIPPDDIRDLVGPAAFQRGGTYFRTGLIDDLAWHRKEGRLHARAHGTGAAPYEVDVRLSFEDDPDARTAIPEASDCSCPVGFNCKHVAAVLLQCNDLHRMDTVEELSRLTGISTATMLRHPTDGSPVPGTGRDSDERWIFDPLDEAAPLQHDLRSPRTSALPTWQQRLQPLLSVEPSSRATTPLALGLELLTRAEGGRYGFGQKPRPFSADDLLAARVPSVNIRPLIPGKKGNWIKGSLKWTTVANQRSSMTFDPEQAEWFTLLHELYISSELGRFHADEQRLDLTRFSSPRLWRMLDWAADIGIPLIGAAPGLTVRRGTTGSFRLDARTGSGGSATAGPGTGSGSGTPLHVDGFRLHPEVTIDETLYPHGRALPIGNHGFAGISVHDGVSAQHTRGLDLVLAPTSSPTPPGLRSLLINTEPLDIPTTEAPIFFTDAYPEISAGLDVRSSDDSVDLPTLDPAQLRLDLTSKASDDSIHMEWSWQYHDPDRTLNLFRHRGESGRDVRRETSVIATVSKLWPSIGAKRSENLTGLAAADFCVRVLPGLEDLAEVTVHFDGQRPTYRELRADPHVKVTASESEANDWFDLGIEITVDGTSVPFVTLFKALANGQAQLLLDDGSFFSLDHPAFDSLRDLLAEAEALSEWSPDDPKISRYQAGLWSELEELADETEEAARWEASMAALSGVESITEVPVPDGLQAELRHYQLEGFRWLVFLWSHSLGGILADDMGLGKTMQTLALIAHARCTDSPTREADVSSAPFLVVAPTSVVGNWKLEAGKFAPGLRVTVIDSTTRKRRTELAEEIAGADLVITSYAVLRLDAEAFGALDWEGLVLDEAQFVKNSAAKVHQVARSIRAPFRLAITGTPMENSLGDLWSLSSITSPGLFPSKVKFRDEFVKPIESGEAPEKMERLRRRVRPFMLRRQKELVAAELPPKQEQVLSVELEKRHRKLYDTVLQRERKQLLGMLGDMDKNRFAIFRSLTLLRMLALDPAIVDESSADVPSSKLDALIDHLDDIVAEGHRTLVFSQFTSFLGRIAARLDAQGIDYAYLDGSTRNRGDVIESFRTGSAPVFLISLKAGGFGLTLTEADYVFLMDPWWNPATENQAIDRTHRIGQTKNVMVYRLVSEGTIEEKVVALQQRKAELFSALMDNGEAFSSAISADDIRELLGDDGS